MRWGAEATKQVAPHPITLPEARGTLFADLGVGETPSKQALDAEAIRVTLWALSAHGNLPVYVSRLLNGARAVVPDWVFETGHFRTGIAKLTPAGEGDDTRHTNQRAVLDSLAQIGDVNSVPGGYWLPAPLRLVPLTAINRMLAIGGTPYNQFPESLAAVTTAPGLVRIVSTAAYRPELAIPTQCEGNWRGVPRMNVTAYAAHVLQSPSLTLFESDEAASFEIYDPTARESTQFHRWTGNFRRLRDGRHFARRRMGNRTISYNVVAIRGRKITQIATPNLESGASRRVLYGLDASAANPVRVAKRPERDGWMFEATSALPNAEMRLLLALGTLIPNANGESYPYRWHVPDNYSEQVERALADLAVRIVAP